MKPTAVPARAQAAVSPLKQRVEARDRLLHQAESVGAQLQQEVLAAMRRGDVQAAQQATAEHDRQLRELAENLRIYQAELHAQADELASAQQRSEQLLSRFAALFGSLPVAALLVGFNGEILECNGRAAQLLGLRVRGAVVRFLHRMVEERSYQERVRPAFHEARDSGGSALDQVPMLGEDGRRFVAELHIARLPGPAPLAAGGALPQPQFSCVVIDRSAQLQTEQALRQSEADLAEAARMARTGGWELQLRPRQLRWSRELLALFGLGPVAPAGVEPLEALLALCSPYERARLAHAMARAEAGQAFEFELDMHNADGRPLRMLVAGHASTGSSPGSGEGPVERVSGVFQDISLQAEARHRIDDLTERLSLANEAGGIGVWDWDLETGELLLDERLHQLLGLAPGSVPPRADLVAVLGAHLLAEDQPLLAQAVATTLQQHTPLNLELRRRPWPLGGTDMAGAAVPVGPVEPAVPVGRYFLHITGRAHFDADGRPLRLVGCAWDSSPEHEAARLRAAKEAAESASRAKSAFLSRMSHELRTPLNAILGFSQLMRMEAEGGDLLLKPHRVGLIENAARHLLELVNEVLDVSRIESGQLQVHLAALPLQPVVAEVLSLLQGQAEQARVSLHAHLPAQPGPPELTVLADRLRLKEVLINLVSNAIKYNRPGGRVDVDAQPVAEGLLVSVRDTGRGLDELQLSGLFQPFNRLGAEASGIEGTGMGLFVSQRFMELMGGRIGVQSSPGQGTTVQVLVQVPG